MVTFSCMCSFDLPASAFVFHVESRYLIRDLIRDLLHWLFIPAFKMFVSSTVVLTYFFCFLCHFWCQSLSLVMTKRLKVAELGRYIDSKLDLDICNNSVLTERTIRDMAEIATKTSSEKREAMIQAVCQHRQKSQNGLSNMLLQVTVVSFIWKWISLHREIGVVFPRHGVKGV